MRPVERYRIEVKVDPEALHLGSTRLYYKVLPLVESHIDFSSWEEASIAGKIALTAFRAGIAEERKSSA